MLTLHVSPADMVQRIPLTLGMVILPALIADQILAVHALSHAQVAKRRSFAIPALMGVELSYLSVAQLARKHHHPRASEGKWTVTSGGTHGSDASLVHLRFRVVSVHCS